jgi:peptidoglycan/xylan/chitin deacetylase (PgdA/CDA1 family)
MSDALSSALCALGVPALFRFRNRRRLLILMYHGVVPRPLDPFCWHMLPVDSFRRQVDWVARRYRVLPLSEALARLRDGTLPPRACAITFDDGFANDLEVADPVLRERALPATVFLATGAIGGGEPLWPDRLWLAVARATAERVDLTSLGGDVVSLATSGDRARAFSLAARALKALPRAEKDARLAALVADLAPGGPPGPGPFRPLTWAEVKALGADGRVRFGAHTVTHEILSGLPDDEVLPQVRRSQEEVSARVGYVPDVFAYPNGRARDFDERSKAAVRACRIPWALTTVEGLVAPGDDPLALRRMSVGADLSFSRFRLLVSGALLALRGERAR